MCSTIMFAQSKVGVSTEQVEGRPGTYDVIYVPPTTSVYGTSASEDTIFCAAIIGTMHGKRGIVLPMKRLDTALYRVRLVLPDSTYTVRLEICIPTDRVPNGILEFTYQADGAPLLANTAIDVLDNADSAISWPSKPTARSIGTSPWRFCLAHAMTVPLLSTPISTVPWLPNCAT
ncbi:MAG: hypothetical protein SGJ05_12270 [bacterium]|nr:hypothetical protein [bacterium]